MNRYKFFTSVIGVFVGHILSILAFIAAGVMAKVSSVATLLLISAILLGLGMTFYLFKVVNKRLKDVFPGMDSIMLNGIFWLTFIMSAGLSLIVLMILPTNVRSLE